jgi:hypothetical protein
LGIPTRHKEQGVVTRAHWLLVGFLLAVTAAFAAGLPGTFVLDDQANFAGMLRYARGEIDWKGAVFGNGSGPLGRPVSMASLLLTTACCGYSPLALKAANIALHLVNGVLVAMLVREILAAMRVDARSSGIWAVAIACWWMVLPIHVGTVLYAVQRMTMLCGTFTLLALLAYARARSGAALAGLRPPALWLAVPAFTALAMLAKENGALAPLLCLVLEICIYRNLGPAPRNARVLLGLFAVLPVLLAVVVLAAFPERVLAGYELRNFTLPERLLTEPRILWEYVASILLPFGPGMGLIQDDIAVSTGLLSPPVTIVALGAWIAAGVAAIALRRTLPLASAGVLFFLAGHALESTLIPLELKFEHRNYVPALGVLLAAAGLVQAVHRRLPAPTAQFRIALPAVGVLLVVALLFATGSRALVWRSEDTLVAQALLHRSGSPRLNAMLGARLMTTGQPAAAIERFALAAQGLVPREQGVRHLWEFLAHCYAGQTAPDEVFSRLVADPPSALSTIGVQAVAYAVEAVESGRCPADSARPLADGLGAWVRANTQSATALGSWRLRFELGRLLASIGRYPEAAVEVESAWRNSGRETGVGIVLFQIHASANDRSAARALVRELELVTPAWDRQARKAIARFRAWVDEDPVSDSSPAGSGGRSDPM